MIFITVLTIYTTPIVFRDSQGPAEGGCGSHNLCLDRHKGCGKIDFPKHRRSSNIITWTFCACASRDRAVSKSDILGQLS